jgi:hypothetical protein
MDDVTEGGEGRQRRYQVVGECAHVEVVDISGVSAINLLYKGAFLPDGVDEARLRHLLDVGLVAEVGEVPIAPNASIEQDPTVGIPTPTAGDADADGAGDGGAGVKPATGSSPEDRETERRRADAKAKLPADGSAPDGRASTETWVEYAVVQGLDRDEASKASKSDLMAALKRGK